MGRGREEIKLALQRLENVNSKPPTPEGLYKKKKRK
jgi:hypothetical protein